MSLTFGRDTSNVDTYLMEIREWRTVGHIETARTRNVAVGFTRGWILWIDSTAFSAGPLVTHCEQRWQQVGPFQQIFLPAASTRG